MHLGLHFLANLVLENSKILFLRTEIPKSSSPPHLVGNENPGLPENQLAVLLEYGEFGSWAGGAFGWD